MNRTVTHLAENLIEWGYKFYTYRAPNPFRPLDSSAGWWLKATPEEFYAIPLEAPPLVFTPLAEAKGERLGRFRFPSSFYSPYPVNNTVHGLADLRPDGSARAALVFLHGHMMTRATLFPLLWYSRNVVKEGI